VNSPNNEQKQTKRKPTAVTSFNNILEVSALEERRSTRENWDEERQNAEKECKSWREKTQQLKHNNLSILLRRETERKKNPCYKKMKRS